MQSLRTAPHRFAALCALLAGVVGSGIGIAHAAPGDLDAGFGAGSGKVTTAIGTGGDYARALAVQPDGKLVVAGYCNNGGNSSFCLARYNADGSLDTGFNGSGKVVAPIGTGFDYVYALALQPDGKLVAAGSCANSGNRSFCLARYNADGNLDTGFNGSGKVVTPIGSGDDYAYALAVQPDGKLVAAGTCANGGPYDFCLARYNTNGSLDTSFNGSGKVITSIGSGDDNAYALAVQPDGKLAVAGTCSNGGNSDFCLARYNNDGSLDTSFNGSGKVITSIGSGSDYAVALALQPDGKLVATGGCGNGLSADFCLARHNTDGSLDNSFNGSGKVVTSIGNGVADAKTLALQPDGKLVVAGVCATGSNHDFCLTRYNADGSLDTAFNGSGVVVTPVGSNGGLAHALALQPDGKLVAAGYCRNGTEDDFCLARYEGGPFGYQNCSLDIDGDNQVLAATDSLIHARIALGLTGNAVVNGISFPVNATRTTWPLIRNYLVSQCGMSLVP